MPIFRSSSKKSVAPPKEKSIPPQPSSSFRVLPPSAGKSRPASSSGVPGRQSEGTNTSTKNNTSATGLPLLRTASRGNRSHRNLEISTSSSRRAGDIGSAGIRSVPDQLVSGSNRNSTQSHTRSERSSYQQYSPPRGAPPPSRLVPPRMPSTRSIQYPQEGRRSVAPPTPRLRRLPPQDGPYPASSYNSPQRPSSFVSVDSLESFNTNPVVDRYPRPYVTPKTEFTNPTINGLNPTLDRSRNQSMTSEFAATYSLEGVEGFPDAMPPSRRGPTSQGGERRQNDALAVPDGRGDRPRSFNGQANPGRRGEVKNNGNLGSRGPGGMGMSMSMAGSDGLDGLSVGRRNRPGAPPVPRIPSKTVSLPPINHITNVLLQAHMRDQTPRLHMSRTLAMAPETVPNIPPHLRI